MNTDRRTFGGRDSNPAWVSEIHFAGPIEIGQKKAAMNCRTPNCACFGSAGKARGGSALIIALWTIALLSMLVMSFALDAMLEGKINVYVRQRRQVDYLTQSGIAIAEMLLLDYKNASSASASSSSSLDEEAADKWLQYKLDLQRGSATVGEYVIVEGQPEKGVVTVVITSAEANKWPANMLLKSVASDKIWENILTVIGLPMAYREAVIDSWYDWRDEDRTVTGRNGAEDEYYAGLEKPYKTRNGVIASVDEMKMIKGIFEHPAIFNGGVLNPEEKDKKAQINILYGGLKAFFDIYGETVKINVNSANKEVLMTVPGIYAEGDAEGLLAGAIVEERTTGQQMASSDNSTSESRLFKDWSNLNGRIIGGVPIEAEPYLSYAPEKYFEITVTGSAGGVSHRIVTVAIVASDKVRYLQWREDP
jgi:general secretion pathway protein K